ncbi:uncharacterized protein si:ch211-106e7.2 [Syngnathus scovelli]|uniref:uncharacterized protein si:ch211-106e7.2 n=1 Tax=Syngnathus scovelli TaxID=161590 RepID=UPI00210F36DC|nr:uncharacterized protein si:ch211-106e7.2 [Syngnathus scovelli]
MYLTWQSGPYQGPLSLSQCQAQLARHAVNPGVNPQQNVFSSHGGGPSNRHTDGSRQTACGSQFAYQEPTVNPQNPPSNVQGRQPSHLNGHQIAVNHSHSSVQYGPNQTSPVHYQDGTRHLFWHYNPISTRQGSNNIAPALENTMSNERLNQVFNQVFTQSQFVTCTKTPPQVRHNVSRTAHNIPVASVNRTQNAPYLSAQNRNVVSSSPNQSIVSAPSTCRNLQVSGLNRPTEQFSSTVVAGSKTVFFPVAETQHSVIVTAIQGSTCQQTTTQQNEGKVTTDTTAWSFKKNPLLVQLLQGAGSESDSAQSSPTNRLNDNSIPSKVIAVVQPLSAINCSLTHNVNLPTVDTQKKTTKVVQPLSAINCSLTHNVNLPTVDTQKKTTKVVQPLSAINCSLTHNVNLPTVDTQKKTTKEDGRGPTESETQPQFNKCQSRDTSAPRHIDDTLSKGQRIHPTATKQANNMLRNDHSVGACASQPVTLGIQEKDSGANNKEMSLDPKACPDELSSLPTIQWTREELISISGGFEVECAHKEDLRKDLLILFWGANINHFSCSVKGFPSVLRCVVPFCAKYVRDDTVVVTQVAPSSVDQLKNYHALEDGEVYTEQPYTSSWLNLNEQLDDIDKEFGPNVYRHFNQPDPVKRVASISSQNVSNVPRPDSDIDDKECNDPLHFEIQVLSPKKAKAIYEQGHVGMSQNTEIMSEPEVVAIDIAVVDEPLEDHVTSRSEIADPLKHFCCVAKWKETILGSKTPLNEKCQCKEELCDFTKKRKEINCPQFTIEPDLQETPEGDMASKSQEKMSFSLPTISWLEICNDISETFELNDDEETNEQHEPPPKGSQAAIISDRKGCLSICDLLNRIDENEEDFNKTQPEPAESCPSTESHTSDTADSEEDSYKAWLKPAESCLSRESHTSDDDSSTENPILSPMSPNDHVEQAPTASSRVTKSPLETEQQIQYCVKSGSQNDISITGTHETDERKRKRLGNPNTIFPYLKKLMSKNVESHGVDVSKNNIDESDDKPLVSIKKIVKLVLFGSVQQEKHASNNHDSGLLKPPEVIFATVDSKKKLNRGGPKSFGSASRNTLSQSQIKLGSHMTLSTTKEKKKCTDDKDLAAQQSQSVKRDKRKNESGHQADVTIQENVLKFNVLPTTFSFEDESSGAKATTEDSSDKPSSEYTAENPHKKSRLGAWSPLPVKNVHGADSSSSGVFAEYQKKYVERSKSSICSLVD